jgi:hypothetical protein
MAGTGQTDVPHRRVRTAIANGRAILEGVDGRTHVARRYRELNALISRDVSPDVDLTEAQKQLIRSAAGLVVLRERLDVKSCNGEQIDAGEYCAVSNTLRRVLVTIGLKRVPKDINGESDEAKLSRLLLEAAAEPEEVNGDAA